MNRQLTKKEEVIIASEISNLKVFHDFLEGEFKECGGKIAFDKFLSVNCDFPLFFVEPDFDVSTLDVLLAEMEKTIPAIKRIFSKPIIHLKETSDVLPVESVRTVNNETINHVASHSETIGNIINGEIVPKKLLTKVYDDDYGIYENVIFCNAVDDMLRVANRNVYVIKNLIYSLTTIQKGATIFNHKQYLSAVGRLSSQFSADAQKYYSVTEEYIEKFRAISDTIQPRLKSKIYARNRHRNHNLSLHKTNIFRMQKDYHKVYNTYKLLLSKNKTNVYRHITDEELKTLKHDYFMFNLLLTVFSIGFFSFEQQGSDVIDFNHIDSTFEVIHDRELKLHISAVEDDAIILKFINETEYTICIVPQIGFDGIEIPDSLKDVSYDELVATTLLDVNYLNDEEVLVDIPNIDSFLRIQQIVLRGLIHSDTERTHCPYCGGSLEIKGNKHYLCKTCKLELVDTICPETNEETSYTFIAQKDVARMSRFVEQANELLDEDKKVEASLFYKNITRINEKGQIICNKCGKIHDWDM